MTRLVMVLLSVLLVIPAAAATDPIETMDLRSITRTTSPNDALACPEGVCSAPSDITSPIVKTPAASLLKRARAVLPGEPRTEIIGDNSALSQIILVQRTPLLGFPDTIWVQIIETEGGASVIIYSKSTYGYWDLGVNRSRVDRWLARLVDDR